MAAVKSVGSYAIATVGAGYTLGWDGAAVKLYPRRESLTADRTYYVRTDGNNANDGLSNTAGGAKLTVQSALDAVAKLDLYGFTVTIQIADGTYTGNIVVPVCVGQKQPQNLVINGNATTPANVVLTHTAANAATVQCRSGAACRVTNLRLSANSTASLLQADRGTIEFGNVAFGTAQYHIEVKNAGYVTCTANYSITAGASVHYAVAQNGNIDIDSKTITLTGTPAFSYTFCNAQLSAAIRHAFCTFTGAATGSRYIAEGNGAIQTGGAGATYFPGSVAGTTPTGGQYL